MTRKNTKTIASVVLAGALFLGAVSPVSALTTIEANAQIQVLMAKIAELQAEIKRLSASVSVIPPTTPPVKPDRPDLRICKLPFVRPVALGARGEEVKDLQAFLRAEGTLTVEPTGFFGTMTQGALKTWQSNQGVVAADVSAGWGTAGPRTHEFIRKRCGDWGSSTICTKEYNLVCGQKVSCPACATATPACLAPCSVEQKTYSNRCHMNADGATLVRESACENTTI